MFDYYLLRHGRLGIDGKGTPIYGRTHLGRRMDDAYCELEPPSGWHQLTSVPRHTRLSIGCMACISFTWQLQTQLWLALHSQCLETLTSALLISPPVWQSPTIT